MRRVDRDVGAVVGAGVAGQKENSMTKRCDGCKFFGAIVATVPMDEGFCRRRAPTQVEPLGALGRWPRCRLDDWCGEWQPTVVDGGE